MAREHEPVSATGGSPDSLTVSMADGEPCLAGPPLPGAAIGDGGDLDVRSASDIAKLAHELRTPLGAIAVLAEIMRDERLGPLGSSRYKGYAADIHQSAAHANAVLAGWLEPAGRDVGALEFVELDIAEVVAGTASALTPLAERAGVALAVKCGQGLPRVIADRRSVRQILNNLIANGLKYTPPGGGIVIGLAYVPGGPVVLDVTDTGDGMSGEELRRVQSGGAGPEPLRRRSGGSGIGLPLVRALAVGCGASLQIDSTAGKGTRAAIIFPHNRVVPV